MAGCRTGRQSALMASASKPRAGLAGLNFGDATFHMSFDHLLKSADQCRTFFRNIFCSSLAMAALRHSMQPPYFGRPFGERTIESCTAEAYCDQWRSDNTA